jgi:hypothetical protein
MTYVFLRRFPVEAKFMQSSGRTRWRFTLECLRIKTWTCCSVFFPTFPIFQANAGIRSRHVNNAIGGENKLKHWVLQWDAEFKLLNTQLYSPHLTSEWTISTCFKDRRNIMKHHFLFVTRIWHKLRMNDSETIFIYDQNFESQLQMTTLKMLFRCMPFMVNLMTPSELPQLITPKCRNKHVDSIK